MKETVVVWDKSVAPTTFKWTVQYGPGYDLFIGGNVFLLSDSSSGEDRIRSGQPVGWDSAVTGINPNGSQPVRITIQEESPYQGRRVISLTPNPEDMASAVGTVYLDPPITLTGATAIDDASLQGVLAGADPDNNYGGTTSLLYDSDGDRKFLIRANTSSLPKAVYTSAAIKLTAGGSRFCYFRRVLDANADWVEGTSLGNAQTGSVCWSNKIYDATTPTAWAGSAGCSTNTVDYTTGGSSAGNIGPGQTTITLTASLFTNWANGTFANGGYVVTGDVNATFCSSTEDATGQPEFELIYEDTGSKSIVQRFFCR